VKVMDVKLVMAKGRPREHTIQLRSEETVIGRHRDCNLRIPSSDVSRRHCLLRFKDGCLWVEDLGSTNGTFVNGEPVKARRRVEPGDELGVGPVSFAVEYQMPAGTPSQSPEAVTAEEVDVPEVEVVEEEEEAVIVIDEAEDGELFNFHAESPNAKTPTPPGNAPAAKKQQDEEVLEVQFDLDTQQMKLPDDGDLRDILSRLDH
jgi:predicted component of type VI protein secretion system